MATQSATKYEASTCDACSLLVPVLRVVEGARLCDGCAETSERIDQRLVNVGVYDPVACDACDAWVDFDARVAVITRECGGDVLCDHCRSTLDVEEGLP